MTRTSRTGLAAGTDGPIPPDLIRAYAAGQLTWSQLRAQTGVEDFREVLQALGQAGLRLPRAPRDRPPNARHWLKEALSQQPARPPQDP